MRIVSINIDVRYLIPVLNYHCLTENESTEGDKTQEEGETDPRPVPEPMDAQDYDTRSEAGSSDGSLNNEEESGESGMSLSLSIYNNSC